MLERRYGRIINISSLAGHTSFPYTEAYAAAKDGLTAFSRVLTATTGNGVSATGIILGPVKDAGVSARTLAETGLTASTAFSVNPQKVAAATLRAIGNPKPEIVVSIGPGRVLKALLGRSSASKEAELLVLRARGRCAAPRPSAALAERTASSGAPS